MLPVPPKISTLYDVALLIEKLNDKDALAVNYNKGVYYLAQDSGFMRHLNENALLGQDRFFDIKSSYSKFYNLGH